MADKLKQEAVQAFGGRCQCPHGCAVTHPDLLEFAHPNHDGGKNREIRNYHGRRASRRKYVGPTLLRQLKKAGWADETPETGKVLMLCKLCHAAYDARRRGVRVSCKEFHGIRKREP
jgi:hypothetical protein